MGHPAGLTALRLGEAVTALLGGRAVRPRRVLVVGGGISGLSAAWALARRGHAVTVVDAGPIPNPDGVSHDEGRIIRHAYGTMGGYARMMPGAFSAWRTLFAETGADRLIPARAVYPIREEGPWEGAVAADLARSGLAVRRLDAAAARGLGVLALDGVLRVVEVEGSAMLRAADILGDLAALLPRLGVVLRPGARVVALGAAGAHLADGTRLAADVTLAAAGPGLRRLLPDAFAAAGLRVSLQTVAWLEPPADLAAPWASAPMLHCRLPGHPRGGVYVLPPRAGMHLKIGDYAADTDPEPDTSRDALRPERVASLLDAGARALHRFADHRVTRARHCRYVMAPEDRFVLRPALPNTWLLSACSGHGFKLAPLIALGCVAAVEEALAPEELGAWAAGREGEASTPARSA